jgi:hypothetical protein
MKLFISYSHDEAWVNEFWRALRIEGGYDAWMDQLIAPGVDWWASASFTL